MKNIIYLSIFVMVLSELSCTKFLDEKPDQQLTVPSNVKDLQAILDDYYNINQQDPTAGERSADNYYLNYQDWQSLNDKQQKRAYIWEDNNLFNITGNTEWSLSYDNVYRANIVLDGLQKIKKNDKNTEAWNNTKGHALFIRAKNFLQIADIWALAYNEKTASTDLGIPLRLDPDFNKISVRSNVKDTYQQIISDLKASIPLLPVHALHLLRPSRPAAMALLARTYLSMQNYKEAENYSDSALNLKSNLLDFNTVDTSAMWSFNPRFSNPEILVAMYTTTPGTLLYDIAKIDTTLYDSYLINDLRKSVFFNTNSDGSHGFKGSYTGMATIFSGLATDEVYLTKAESLARLGKVTEAMKTLNMLLQTRWRDGTFIPLTEIDQQKALKIILEERRKELLMRGIRWMDIKRLNVNGANITLKRVLNGKVYTLPPNDLRYALPIPEDVIELTGMPQNPR